MTRWLLLLLPLLSACGWMWDQPKVRPFREAPLQVQVAPERVRFGENLNLEVRTGLKPEGGFADNPYAFTDGELVRGKVLYRSFCAICHGLSGEGDGRVIPLGMPKPRSFLDPGVKAMPEGYFYFAATNGFGRMLSYKSRIPERERWLIAHYIKRCLLEEACPLEVINAEVY
ncbi:cytochrome C oxidase Cbb3 [Thermus scotoductus]|uniref:Cytochrome C oxidase Cbb3 n=1 Tax=Thermus scotoductus TaxID=37636 RepID=A0A430QWU4_THESC|nr:cytochrome c [Thermus scotoductus]RTG99610.1 cytochrome C oxidase Cbb3 [Thermus scotoductus]RTH20215.1 cytochrome C oxidase Cbb3 [Thermus scotoductus]RTH31090.1 cytochrome C oxidase Cbb3 [Thermus scotoductus]RTI07834.1 cytochrome C oxidase Cbb3 [Thermus scotoductus]RTI16731.1 cytochrome C oxidase Cbb3 [Thermus scotoductus]